MSSEPPKPGAIPGWGQPADASPTEPVPDPAAPAADAPSPGWGQPPAPADPAPAAPAAPASAAPDAPSTGWGQQPDAPPPSTPPAAPPPQAPVPQAPPAAGGWGAAPAPGALPPGQVPGGTAPPGWNPQPVAPSNNNGCLKACLIVGVLLVILFFIGVAAVVFLGNQVVQSIGVDPEGNLETCPFVSDEELSAVLGSGTQALPLQGFFDATIGLILDKRVMPDEEDCWITSDGTNGTGRIARYQGPDAAAKFQAEKQRAQPTSDDQGGGVTIENAGYFGGDLTGFGDEAFCTGVSNAIMSGVLVRQGDTLVYVSLLGGVDTGPGLGATPNGVVVSEATCQQAQEVALAILR